jgi:hypothetical protein
MLQHWKTQVLDTHNNGTKLGKMNDVKNYVSNKFEEAVDEKKGIHGITVRMRALARAQEIGFEDFTASCWWLHHFKVTHGIGDRAITRIVSKRQMLDSEEIIRQGNQFVRDVREEMRNVGTSNTYNTVQSSCDKKLHRHRTLTYKGVKAVDAIAQSVNATTHTYKMQSTIRADGKILEKTLIVLQEPEGMSAQESTKTFSKRKTW